MTALRSAGQRIRSKQLGARLVVLSVMLVGLTLGVTPASAMTLGVGWTESASIGSEMPLVREAGAERFREPLPFANNNDSVVEAAARNGVTITAQVGPKVEAVPTGAERTELISGIANLVKRYGYNGQFWSEHPGLPYRPIGTWEFWNEPNLHYIPPYLYGPLLKEVASAIQSASQAKAGRGTEVLSGGLLVRGVFGGTSGDWYERGPTTYQGALKYLEESYSYFGGAGSGVTGIAFHPYEIEPGTYQPGYSRIQAYEYAVNGFRNKVATLSASLSLSITEAGWAVGAGSEFVTAAEQATLLKQAVAYASASGVKEFDWYNLRDPAGGSDWKYRCGLLANNWTPRASWYAFQELTGGPRALESDSHPVVLHDPNSTAAWIYYRGSDGRIWEIYRNPETGWGSPQPFVGSSAALGTSPAVVRNPTTAAAWVYYEGSDGRIWEIYRNPSNGWGSPQPFVGSSAAPGTSPVVLHDPNSTAAWVYYQGSDHRIWEIYYNPVSGWGSPQPFVGSSAAPGTSPVVERNPTTAAAWIYYRGSDGRIWEIYRNPSNGWGSPQPFVGTSVAAGTSPVILHDPNSTAAWLYYQGTDGRIWEIYYNPVSGWGSPQPFVGTSAAPGSSPVVVRNPTTAAAWIYYQGSDGRIWEIYRNPETGWGSPGAFVGTSEAPGTSPVILHDPTSTAAWLDYKGLDGRVWEIYYNPVSGWGTPGAFPGSS